MPRAETAFFQYRPGRSPLHLLDPRLKLALAALATAAAAYTGPLGLAGLLALVCALFAMAGFEPRAPGAPAAIPSRGVPRRGSGALRHPTLRLPRYARQAAAGLGLRALLPLCLIVVLGRGMGEAEGPRWFVFSLPGLLSGLSYAGRLAVMALFSSLLVASTTTGALRSALGWILSPLPRRLRARTVMMAGIAMASLPLLARETAEVRLARAARLADRARPLSRRLLSMARPLVRKILLRADTMSAAMEARCYSDAACAEGAHNNRFFTANAPRGDSWLRSRQREPRRAYAAAAAPLPAPGVRQWIAFFACAALMIGLMFFRSR